MTTSNKKDAKKYKAQINTLIKVNHTHIQKQEAEILKQMGQKTKIQFSLQEKEAEIQILQKEKLHFKENYFKTLPSKVFSTQQVNFFRNSLEKFDFQIQELQRQKQKILADLEALEQEIKKNRDKLKKYSFKNEKYDYLKVVYG
jgi:chromosome segregation ATPase